MTREKYEALSVSDLRDIARKREMKIPSRIKKAELIDLMLAQDEQDAKERAQQAAAAAAPASPAPSQSTPKDGIIRRTVVRKKPVIYRSGEPAAEIPQQQRPAPNFRPAPRPEPPRISRPQEDREYEPRYLDGDSSYRDRIDETEDRTRHAVRPEIAPSRRSDLNSSELDSGITVTGILEVMNDGFGFIRSDNYMPGDADVYVAPSQIRKFHLKTGDIVTGNTRNRTSAEKFSALLYVTSVNGEIPDDTTPRVNFEDLTPIFPNEKIRLERQGGSLAMRVMDLMCPVGKGQRGMIVSPPKAGKTTLLKQVASSVLVNNPEIHLIILLIDERPEEVTDIKEAIQGPNVEVIYSTFDELPEHHKRVSEMVIERAKRLVEQKRDVMILIDSITRLTRAYNITEESSGRTLSGGLDPAALHMPKRFFGAARNMREGGSLTILATALIETGSKMDDVVYEEFKGTGNMELILNRRLSERRIFPAVDLAKSGTRRDDLLLTPREQEAAAIIHRMFIGQRAEDATDTILDLFSKTRNNAEFVEQIRRMNAMKWRY
ncbi:MAG: transcription termination factor Rho [Lachnospiraceae bacterium]